MQIMHHLNIKYLLSLYKKAIREEHVWTTCTWDYYSTEDDWKTAYTSVYQIVNYDGCKFQASVKTIKDELKRREEIGEIVSVNHTTPSGRTVKIKWQINKDYKKTIEIMKITLASIQHDTLDIDFQKVFDFMKNEGELENTVYDYGTQFGDNTDYYLDKIYGINISYEDIEDYDCDELNDEKIYPSVLNEYLLDTLCNEYYDWLEANKEKLGLTED